jgi:tripartite-type tricarboxylate transporter receptor subunit TctC
VKDFDPVSLAIEAPILLLVHPAVPVKNVSELIALAKARPNALDFGSAGHGTSTHMAMELFKSMAGVRLVHVPYKGTGQALTDLLAGQIPVLFGNILSCLPYVKAGRLRALAVTSSKRSAAMPELPSIAEAGVPGYNTTTWHGWLAPAGTSTAVVQRLSSEIAKVVRSPEVMQKMSGDGGVAVGSTPEQFARHLVAEIARWRKVVRETGVQVE